MSPARSKGHPPSTTPASAAGVELQYQFGAAGSGPSALGSQRGAALLNPLIELLTAVRSGGSILQAAQALGFSYRYTWGALKRWETALDARLVEWGQGQPARLTPFAERLLWAECRARARLQPHIEALRADLARVLVEARDEHQQLLTLCASHDLALPLLQEHAGRTAALHIDIRFAGSVDALRALNAHRCTVAGFHVPAMRGAAPLFAQAIKPLLKPGQHKLIGCSRRTQGLMLRKADAGRIRSIPELLRAIQDGLRFVNRQPGSGTRLLMDHLLQEHGVAPSSLRGYEAQIEETHVAVAASVASGLAEAGIGVEAAAVEFGLHFVPLIEEDYFLACLKSNLEQPAVLRLRKILSGPAWPQLLAELPGYSQAAAAGEVLAMTQALPWWRYQTRRPPGAAKSKTRADSVPSTPR